MWYINEKNAMNWYKKYLKVYGKPFGEIPNDIVCSIKERIAILQSPNPIVTVSVIAYNEEKNLTACLWSLSDMICNYPVEIIGVDNDSNDRTAEIFQATGVPYYTEHQHSCGFARQCGLNHARGMFHLNIDADTMYPPKYVETMVDNLLRKGVTGVCSSWSYIPDKRHSWFALKCYETSRDIYLWLQHFKRPELSVRGLVFGYPTLLAQKTGIRTDIKRGEDGSLALELKKHGRIVFIHSNKARAITGYGTVGADGSFFNSFKNRLLKALKNVGSLFTKKSHYEDEKENLLGN